MQIKRFEAVDMTEALRLVKREFGDDAVILSAKEIRQRGFFRALRKKRVEIRAATDYPMPEERKEDAFSGMLARQLDEASSADRVSLSTASEAPQAARTSRRPFVRHSGEASRPLERPGRDAAEMDSPHQPVDARPAFSAGPPAAGYAFAPSGRPETAVAAPSTASACPWVVDPFFHGQTRRKVVAMVGTPGAGKSTCVAKLAWRCRAVDKKRVGLISLDRFRVAANSLLERVAGIMNLPLSVVYDAQSMQAALNRMDDVDVVLIDT
ncbi:MAG TPA: hypothetical protein VLT88_02690, partial [Desulfosarcina sp.]|nr:hypothetical protein [Desulfosarcina sp.]